jgi:hypothetical protein
MKPIGLRIRDNDMTYTLDLRQLERKAWKSVHQDGLLDIFCGLVLLQVGVSLWIQHAAGYWTLVFGIAFNSLAVAGLIAGKKLITVPRMGRVEFGQIRKAKSLQLTILLSLAVLLGVALIMLSLTDVVQLPGWAVPAALIAANMLFVFGMLGYFLDYPRLYIYGLLYAAAFPSWVVLIELADIRFPVVSVLSAAVMVLLGCKGLFQFTSRYPVPSTEAAANGNH